jgi:hypothetical protein
VLPGCGREADDDSGPPTAPATTGAPAAATRVTAEFGDFSVTLSEASFSAGDTGWCSTTLPLALASAPLFVLFMGITPGSSPPQLDMFSGGAFPQEAAPMGHGAQQSAGWSLSFEMGSRSFMARATTAGECGGSGHTATNHRPGG